jgi:hypothetical protein
MWPSATCTSNDQKAEQVAEDLPRAYLILKLPPMRFCVSICTFVPILRQYFFIGADTQAPTYALLCQYSCFCTVSASVFVLLYQKYKSTKSTNTAAEALARTYQS